VARTAKYKFPDGMRPATVRERTDFYKHEFSADSVRRWFRGWEYPIVFAAVIGRHTRIYPPEYRNDWRRTILVDEYEDLTELRKYLLDFRPESAYYDRNVYRDWSQARDEPDRVRGLGTRFGQQLALDIDPENFDCPIHGSLDEKMSRHQGLSFCRLELQLARDQAANLFEELSKSFSEIRPVYSGRGFHIHIFDNKTLFRTRKERLKLVRSLVKKGYLMDEWVAAGGMRLIRLPYSLNGLVSRIAIPLSLKDLDSFDPLTDERCIPNYLRPRRNSVTS
jgi:DNA primase catalytic subunit